MISITTEFLVKYPAVYVKAEYNKYLMNGNQLTLSMLTEKVMPMDGDGFRVYDESKKLVGLYLYRGERKQLHPEKMFLP